MNLIWAIILLVGGLAILWKCADWLVSGAVALAEQLGVSPLVIGLTIIAMGTSAPEAAAGIAAAVRGMGDIAIGNVYGSNIANLALVGGLAALIRPIEVKDQTLRYQIPVMIVVTLLLLPVLHNLYLSRPEAILLSAVFAGLILLTLFLARREQKDIGIPQHKNMSTAKSVLLVAIGLAGLALGADMAVRGAVFIGERIGLSKAVIGLTIIAVGTSLPELATCIAASLKGHHDISIGNLVGSNIFNALLVTGAAGTVRPFEIVKRLASVDYWIMLIVTAVFAVMALLGRRIGRIDAVLLLCTYIGYIIYLLAF